MKYLITGSNGQVGSQLIAQLNQNTNTQVLATDKQTLDISDRDAVFAMVHTYQPQVIINAAAYTAVDKAQSEAETAYLINAKGAENLALAAQQYDALFLHISTDYVFDGKGNIPYCETDPTQPQNIYGSSKLAGEKAVANACNRHIILRTSWVFNETGHNFVKTMLKLGKTHPQLNIVSDQFGSPTHASDIAAALIHIAQQLHTQTQSDLFGTYHFSGSPFISWYEFAQAIFTQAQKQNILPQIPQINAIDTIDYPTPAQRPANSRLNCQKIQAAFGIQPSNWQKALENLAAYL